MLAYLVIDSTRKGPAAGGTRTSSYASQAAALEDARSLARAMSHKCALADLDAGGAKAVVMPQPGWNRRAAFESYGRAVAQLDGRFHTAGDFGTTTDDLAAAAQFAPNFVHGASNDDATTLANAVGATVVACAQAAGFLEGKSVAIQGVGDVGAAVARAFAKLGAKIVLADLDDTLAHTIACEVAATVVAPGDLWSSDVDLVAPCAKGGVLTEATGTTLRASVLCGAANCIASNAAAESSVQHRCTIVPDVLSSSGAVIVGVAQSIMRTPPAPFIAGVGDVCAEILRDAKKTGRLPSEVARMRAEEFLRRAPTLAGM